MKNWKNKTLNSEIKEGRWNYFEHEQFLKALSIYGKNWKNIKEFIKTRTISQIRSHAQKYFKKLQKINEKKTKKIISKKIKIKDNLEFIENKNNIFDNNVTNISVISFDYNINNSNIFNNIRKKKTNSINDDFTQIVNNSNIKSKFEQYQLLYEKGLNILNQIDTIVDLEKKKTILKFAKHFIKNLVTLYKTLILKEKSKEIKKNLEEIIRELLNILNNIKSKNQILDYNLNYNIIAKDYKDCYSNSTNDNLEIYNLKKNSFDNFKINFLIN